MKQKHFKEIQCSQCIFKDLCSPWEKLNSDATTFQCKNFIDSDCLELEFNNEYFWAEMSYWRLKDNLFDYVEDNIS